MLIIAIFHKSDNSFLYSLGGNVIGNDFLPRNLEVST